MILVKSTTLGYYVALIIRRDYKKRIANLPTGVKSKELTITIGNLKLTGKFVKRTDDVIYFETVDDRFEV